MTQNPDTARNTAKPDVDAELDALVLRYRGASGLAIDVLNLLGGTADGLIDKLPEPVRNRLQDATELALKQAMKAANGSRRIVGAPQNGWLHTALATTIGMAGGAGGLPSALAELPVTTTILLRAIQDVAQDYGFDPSAENIQFDCIEVFAASGPLSDDDNSDLGFLGARMALSSGGLQKLTAWVAPRLATVLGQKLAAQAVPVLGAAAGAATNYAFVNYYREIAHVHFGLRRLAIETDVPHAMLVEQFRRKLRPELASPAA
ncbi:EcsC family protein [Cognatishimia sp. SS12]|uniref:EcsC family protein n=1 Tax=Cognatishimia sp. SS12 TaxID=2979465 RepID=UPI00232BFC4F|nr:EcsC family protein [Cognatishimia sp. SS12]MDC0736915.1 EcsC family protein [Cognatishimia sp. SS12]